MEKPNTMTLEDWVRAMSSGDRDKSKADLMIAAQLVADARTAMTAMDQLAAHRILSNAGTGARFDRTRFRLKIL